MPQKPQDAPESTIDEPLAQDPSPEKSAQTDAQEPGMRLTLGDLTITFPSGVKGPACFGLHRRVAWLGYEQLRTLSKMLRLHLLEEN